MPEAEYGENPSFYITEKRLGGRAAYDAAKAAGRTGLNYRQWVQVRTPEFKAWFGDWEHDPDNASKVINPRTGEPLVVYHGTKDTEFHVFDMEKSAIGYWGKGFYFSESRAYAEHCAGEDGRVLPVFLKLNPESPLLYPPSTRTPLIKAAWYDKQDNKYDLGQFSTEDDARKTALQKGWDVEGLVMQTVYARGNENPLMNDIADLVYETETRTEENALNTIAKIRGRGFDGIYSPSENFYIAFDPQAIEPAEPGSGLKSHLNYSPTVMQQPQRPSEISDGLCVLENTMEKEPARKADIAHGGLKTARHHYQMHMAGAGTAEKLRCALLEHAMEQTLSGLPPDMQVVARTHFYQSMVRDSVERQYAAEPQPDTGLER